MLKQNSDNLVWIDLEMSGLNVSKEKILEIAVIVTDKNLENAIEGPSIIINQPDEVLENMNNWCQKQHKKTGLIKAVMNSTISLKEAEDKVLTFIKRYTLTGQNILCGNSVGQDQKFLEKYMPDITSHLHYRILDVSSIKESIKRWYDEKKYNINFEKKNVHRALDDIQESIEELKFYKKSFFKDL